MLYKCFKFTWQDLRITPPLKVSSDNGDAVMQEEAGDGTIPANRRCWFNTGPDHWPTLNFHWFNISCLFSLGLAISKLFE